MFEMPYLTPELKNRILNGETVRHEFFLVFRALRIY